MPGSARTASIDAYITDLTTPRKCAVAVFQILLPGKLL